MRKINYADERELKKALAFARGVKQLKGLNTVWFPRVCFWEEGKIVRQDGDYFYVKAERSEWETETGDMVYSFFPWELRPRTKKWNYPKISPDVVTRNNF